MTVFTEGDIVRIETEDTQMTGEVIMSSGEGDLSEYVVTGAQETRDGNVIMTWAGDTSDMRTATEQEISDYQDEIEVKALEAMGMIVDTTRLTSLLESQLLQRADPDQLIRIGDIGRTRAEHGMSEGERGLVGGRD